MLAAATSARGSFVSILVLTLRFAVASVLAVAAIAKARDFETFQRTVRALVPRGARLVSAGVIATEATLAALLASGLAPSAVAAATLVLVLGFSALSVWVMGSGVHASCKCFGSRRPPVTAPARATGNSGGTSPRRRRCSQPLRSATWPCCSRRSRR